MCSADLPRPRAARAATPLDACTITHNTAARASTELGEGGGAAGDKDGARALFSANRFAEDLPVGAQKQRVIKTAVDPDTGDERHTLYVFPTLELRRARYGTAYGTGGASDYELAKDTEVPYLLANGVRVGRVVYDEGLSVSVPGNQRVYLEMGDHLGSTSIVIDKASSEVVERTTYYALGKVDSDYRPDRWKSFREDYKFTGKEEDVEVGLVYFGKRYYAPGLGRWVSADPLGVHDVGKTDANLYAYVTGRALRAIDPVGLCPNEGGGGCTNNNSGGSEGTSGTDPHGTGGGSDAAQDPRTYTPPDFMPMLPNAARAEPVRPAGHEGAPNAEPPRGSGSGGVPGVEPKGAPPEPEEPKANPICGGTCGDELGEVGRDTILGVVPGAQAARGLGAARGAAGARIGGEAVEKGLAREGVHYELKFVDRHLPGTEASQRLIRREGAAHVFTDRATMEMAENAVFARGQFTGVVRETERYGLRFKNPIGYRIDAAGKKIPLHYAEAKLNPATGGYHVIPRTGPSSP